MPEGPEAERGEGNADTGPAFLLDANMPRSAAEVFDKRGYEVEDVRDIGLGHATDPEIIQHARGQDRIVVTRDTDFGQVLRYPSHPGALILRLPHTFIASSINERLETFLDTIEPQALDNAIIVVELDRYRRREIG